MNKLFAKEEKGQTIVIIALIAVVLFGMIALLIDGGHAYSDRRAAQNAADAGALAGADELCKGHDEDVARDRAWDYIENNEASVPHYPDLTQDILIDGRTITVTTVISSPTFFAGVIGINELIVNATASAGCFLPCTGERLLPVAWSCSPPAGAPEDPPVQTCQIVSGTVTSPGPLYVVMDAKKEGEDFSCKDPSTGLPTNGLNCDFTGPLGVPDGINDVFTGGGGRGWLNLDGGSGSAAELKDWIANGSNFVTPIHSWRPASEGMRTSVFDEVANRIFPDLDPVVFLPVFDEFCQTGDPRTECTSLWHNGVDNILTGGGSAATYFHIINFSAFHLTCVDIANNKQTYWYNPPTYKLPPGMNYCPGKQAILTANPDITDNSFKTIEGYFLQDYQPEFDGKCGEGGGSGIYTLYLK